MVALDTSIFARISYPSLAGIHLGLGIEHHQIPIQRCLRLGL
jgi:hypothetical protein